MNDIFEAIDEFEPGIEARRDAKVSLEVAAALLEGADERRLDVNEWSMACECEGLPDDSAPVGVLIDGGFLVDGEFRGDDEWVDALAQTARREGRWIKHHAACARSLLIRYPNERRDGFGRIVAGRLAHHLIEAGKPEEALASLLAADKEAMDSGDHQECLDLLAERDRLLDRMGAPSDEPARAQNDWRRARSLFWRGDIEQAEAFVRQSVPVLVRHVWAAEAGQALLLMGRILRSQGRHAEAIGYYDDAIEHLAVAGDEHGLTRARASRAYIQLLQGRYEAARAAMLKAINAFEALGDLYLVGSLWTSVAQSWLGDGDLEAAVESAEKAMEVATREGHRPVEANSWIMLGEAARLRKDWDEARRCYSKAAELFQLDGNRPYYVSRYNLALTEIGAGNFGLARDILSELTHQYVEIGCESRLAMIYAGLMTCAVGEGDWDGWDENYRRAVTALPDIGGAHEDIAWMAELIVRLAGTDVADRQGVDRDRVFGIRDKALALACEQNERLGNAEKVRALQQCSEK
jgi:tetratricopeptide (TPR) repeat protein